MSAETGGRIGIRRFDPPDVDRGLGSHEQPRAIRNPGGRAFVRMVRFLEFLLEIETNTIVRGECAGDCQ